MSPLNRKSQTPRAAFTLIELLVTIAVVTMLCVATVAGLKHWRYSVNRAESIAAMQQTGMALAQYVSEYGELPSPLWSYQTPGYRTDPTSLVYHLAPYLQTSEATKDGDLLPGYVPPFLKQWYLTKHPASPSIYTLHYAVTAEDGSEFHLWGYPASGTAGPISPVKWSAACATLPLSTTEALSDWTSADQVTPSQKEHQLPSPYELQNYKTRLFLDWHCETAQLN